MLPCLRGGTISPTIHVHIPLPALRAWWRLIAVGRNQIMSTHIQRSALLPFPAPALYALVNDVARYPEFLPWCAAASVLEETPELMRAGLTVAKGSISQRFVTRNTLTPGTSIEMNLEEGPFSQLHGIWQFKALGDKACKISLDLTFDYAGPLVKATLGPLFTQAANPLVDAFCQRAKQLHG